MYCQHNFYLTLKQPDIFTSLMQQEGKIYRQVKQRKTIRFTREGNTYFAKLFWGISVSELVKNLLKGQLPIIDASHEKRALEKLANSGVRVPQMVAYDAQGLNPLNRRSCIVMQAVEPSISLEDYLHQWQAKPLLIRRALIRKVAETARIIHEKGIQHRDFYICHFLLHTPQGEQQLQANNLELSVIDWHRARFSSTLSKKRRIKDLSALYFSVLSSSLNWRDYYRFLRVYTQKPLRETLADPIWKKITKRAIKLYKKTFSTQPAIFQENTLQHAKDDYLIQKSRHKLLVICKEMAVPELLHLLGDPDSVFTRADAHIMADNKLATSARIKIRDSEIVIKRYRWRQGWTGWSRLFRPTRAARCWHFAQRLLKHGVLTPEPIALVEKRWGWLRRDSYYVTRYYAAPSLFDFIASTHDPVVLDKIWKKWEILQQKLTAIRLSHGDTNHKNFLVIDHDLMMLDLDTMRRHFFEHRLNRKRERDYQRFLRGWKNKKPSGV